MSLAKKPTNVKIRIPDKYFGTMHKRIVSESDLKSKILGNIKFGDSGSVSTKAITEDRLLSGKSKFEPTPTEQSSRPGSSRKFEQTKFHTSRSARPATAVGPRLSSVVEAGLGSSQKNLQSVADDSTTKLVHRRIPVRMLSDLRQDSQRLDNSASFQKEDKQSSSDLVGILNRLRISSSKASRIQSGNPARHQLMGEHEL